MKIYLESLSPEERAIFEEGLRSLEILPPIKKPLSGWRSSFSRDAWRQWWAEMRN